MIADRVRMEAYVDALKQAVNPDAVVLDIGTGTGIFSMLACQFGARRVYAIEPDDAIQVAREIAAANGFAGRIEFIQELSTRVVLPEPIDVIISDLHGVLPLHQHLIPSIVDARRRLLTPGGRLIPRCEILWAAVAEAPDFYRRHTGPWRDNSYSLDMEGARLLATNTWSKRRVKPEQILLPPQIWVSLDYNSITEPDVSGELTWVVDRPGLADALVVWFDATLAEGVGFSNAPGEPELIYGNAYFPLSEPVTLDAGDAVIVALHADLVGDDYIWRWDTRVLAQEDPERIKASFRQNSLAGVPLSPQQLRRRAHDYVPELNERGAIAHAILEHMAHGTRNEQTAREISARFPQRFPTWQEALAEVGDVATKYCAQ